MAFQVGGSGLLEVVGGGIRFEDAASYLCDPHDSWKQKDKEWNRVYESYKGESMCTLSFLQATHQVEFGVAHNQSIKVYICINIYIYICVHTYVYAVLR